MGYYQVGALASVRPRQSLYSVGASIVDIKWPSQIRAEYQQINTEVTSLRDELISAIKQGGLSAEQDTWLTAVWQPFANEWYRVYDARTKTGAWAWLTEYSYSHWEAAQDWRIKLGKIRDSAEAVGFTFVGPAPTAPREGVLNLLYRMLRWIIYGVVIVGGFWLVRSLMTSTPTATAPRALAA